MPPGQQEHLRDWLKESDIEPVLLIVTCLNSPEPDPQERVITPMHFISGDFHLDLAV